MVECPLVNEYCISFYGRSFLGTLQSKLVSQMETHWQWQVFPYLITGGKLEKPQTQTLCKTRWTTEFFSGRVGPWKSSTFSATSLKTLLALWLGEEWMRRSIKHSPFLLAFPYTHGSQSQRGFAGIPAPNQTFIWYLSHLPFPQALA